MVAAGSVRWLVMKHQRLARLGVLEADAPQVLGIVLAGLDAGERNGLIADDASRAVGRGRVEPPCIHVRLRPCDEEGAGQMQHIESGEIDIAAIHDVDGTWLGKQQVESVHIVQLAVGYGDKAWDIATQIEQGVHLDRGLGGAEMRPRKDRQAKVDGGGIQSVDAVRQVHADVVVGIELSRLRDQALSQLRVDAPVAHLVRVGQRRAPDRIAKAHVVELRGLRREARLNVAQALAIGQLGERHGAILLGAGQRAHPPVAIVARDQPSEGAPWKEIHQLSEQRLAGVHVHPLGSPAEGAPASSNRHHDSPTEKATQSMT